MEAEELKPGDVVAGRFKVMRPLGRGAMGVVFLTEDQALQGPPIVLKMMTSHVVADATDRELFRREVISARSVSHPNVVRVFDYHVLGGVPAITMEFLPGGTLKERLAASPPPTLVQRLTWLAEVAEGLHAVHQAGIVHRDLKPQNVLLGQDGHARLTDFGIARPPSAAGQTVPRFTPMYAAPEQIRGQELTIRTDIYSLAAMAFYVLTGEQVFPGAGMALMEAHVKTPPRGPRSVLKDLPPVADAVVLSCLDKDPARRPASALEVARCFRDAAAEAEPARDAAVFFMDLVAYSAMATQSQGTAIRTLNGIVSASLLRAGIADGDVIKLPTGDGLALVMFRGAALAWKLALDVAERLGHEQLEARMGLHVGSVLSVADINAQRNAAGSGINTCQRVMACGGPGHLLASERFRTALLDAEPDAADAFQGPYERTVKHGQRVQVWNVVTDHVGCADELSAVEEGGPVASPRRRAALMGGGVGVLLVIMGMVVLGRAPVEAPAASAQGNAVEVAPAPEAPREEPAEEAAAPAGPSLDDLIAAEAEQVEARRQEDRPDEEEPRETVKLARRTPRPAAVEKPRERAEPVEKPTEKPAPEEKAAPAQLQPAVKAEEAQPAPQPAPAVDVESLLQDARRAFLSKQNARAVALLKTALRSDPDLADAHKLLGTIHAVEGSICDAKRHYSQYLRLQPGAPVAAALRQKLQQPAYAACP